MNINIVFIFLDINLIDFNFLRIVEIKQKTALNFKSIE